MVVMQQMLPDVSPAMSGRHVGHLLALARLYTSRVVMLHHARSMTALEKQEMLPGIYVQKTLTLRLAEYTLLLSGLGDFRVERHHYKALARILSLGPAEAKRHEINPVWLPARKTTGLGDGMVSPFLPPGFIPAWPITAIVLLPLPPLEEKAQVGISLSLQESLLFPAARLPELVTAYIERYHRHIPVFRLNPVR